MVCLNENSFLSEYDQSSQSNKLYDWGFHDIQTRVYHEYWIKVSKYLGVLVKKGILKELTHCP